ncbi:alpha/beta hydrolase [Hyphomicrobium sp.]|uniref:alpha/beta hydrolase n=1 Tax=Hyphomicrobium sp. TaxID=82 RepID=UPI000FB8E262|nr:alpha/beta hydrolase [Hyphomicrobium sp.]RUP00318.1 MAG: alpha/beta hydrolase [Hyphomicrobium sp.]
MVSLAKGWPRSASLWKFGLTALVASGLLSACTEAPRLAKTGEEQTRSAGAPAPAPPPSDVAVSPAPSGPQATMPPPPEATPPQQSHDQDRAPPDADAEKEAETHHKYKKSARPPAGASQDTPESEPTLGSSQASQPEAPQDQPSPSNEANAPAQPAPPSASEPAGGSAPPTAVESAAPAKPAPAPPPPVAAAPPPAAPATAARAAIESDPNKKYKIVPVFYGTDREIEPDPKRLQFGSGRGHKLQLGRALISVPLSHEVPHIERPRIYEVFGYKIYAEQEDPNKHFTVQEITSLTEDQMLAMVRARLKDSSTFKDHAFVFIHGFNTSFDCALYRTAQITYDLGFDGAPFVYSWPSGGKVASYTYDRGSVEQAEPTLAEFLTMVIQKSGAKSISLIAHSMGNELLLRVLQTLKPKIPRGVVISQVILAAPDVDRDKFNIIAREISNFAKGVTLYAASNDRALGYSQQFWGGVPRAGDIPKDGPLIVPGVDTIDVTAVSTDALGLNHSGYAENPALLDDVKALVEYGIRPPNRRLKSILAVESPQGTFWRFQADQ